ncbi:MAG: TlpA family protein disulfide reductase [Burkholderiaceae bacterium]
MPSCRFGVLEFIGNLGAVGVQRAQRVQRPASGLRCSPPTGAVAGARGWLILATVLVVAATAAWWLLRSAPAPMVQGTDLNGQSVATTALKGKPYLVNFWATSCVTCVKEMPDIVALHEEFSGKGFQTIAVAMRYDRPDFLEKFVQDRELPFTVVHDTTGDWARAFGDVSVTPTTFVIDAKGQIFKRYVGEPDFPALRRWLQTQFAG